MNVEYAFAVGCRFAGFLGGRRVAVGMDPRESSVVLKKAAVSGLLYGGSAVVDMGVVTTPEIFRHVRREGLAGGVMITASHNPKEWNGLKLIREGRGLFEDELGRVKLEACRYGARPELEKDDSRAYYSEILGLAGRGSAAGLKIAVDAGGGSACVRVPKLFNDMGAEVIVVNGTMGVFTRGIDPTQDALEQLRAVMKVSGCDVGFAFDCDGDRLQVVDREGRKMPPDFALMAAVETLPKGSGVAVSVDTSDAVLEAASSRGVSVFLAPVGEANVLKVMLEKDCALGGEGSSAGVIDRSFNHCRDGLLAAAHMVRRRGGLDIGWLAGHHQIRTKVEMERGQALAAIEEMKRSHGDAVTLDGVKVREGEGWWLVRPSRTEDVVRISVEARSMEGAEELLRTVEERLLGRVHRQ